MSASRDRSAPARRGVRFWSRWWLENLCILGAVMVAGLPLFIPIGLVGWGTGEDPLAYVFFWIYLPFSGTAYLALLGAIGSRARRPRVDLRADPDLLGLRADLRDRDRHTRGRRELGRVPDLRRRRDATAAELRRARPRMG